jgi:hypothetical protein
MTGGVCFATRSEEDCFFFDIDVKGGERSRVRNVSGTESSLNGRLQRRVESEYIWVLVLPSMPKGEIVGKYCTDNECVLATDSESAYTCH